MVLLHIWTMERKQPSNSGPSKIKKERTKHGGRGSHPPLLDSLEVFSLTGLHVGGTWSSSPAGPTSEFRRPLPPGVLAPNLTAPPTPLVSPALMARLLSSTPRTPERGSDHYSSSG